MQETWRAMEELVDDGLARNIGLRYPWLFPSSRNADRSNIHLFLSNCGPAMILDVLRYARIEPQVLQVELHPYLTQEQLVNWVKLFGVALTAYSSFGPQVSHARMVWKMS